MPVKVKDLIVRLEADGWFLVRTKGSHRQVTPSNQTGHRHCVRQAQRLGAYRYLEQRLASGRSYGAYVPDLPGCVAVGETREEAKRLIREAIEFHLEGLREDGLPVPTSTSSIELVTVAA